MAKAAKFDLADVDWSEVEKLAKDMKEIRQRTKPAMQKATRKSATSIRDDARVRILNQTRPVTTRKYPARITYEELIANATKVAFEVGPIKRGQGYLGHIFEFGSVNSPPMPHMVPAYWAEIVRYEENMADAIENAVLG